VNQLRQHPEGVEVPGEVALKAYAKLVDRAPKGFATPTRRVEIYAETLFNHGIAPLPVMEAADLPAPPPGYPLRLGAAKVLAFCHSQHRNIESLRLLMPDPQAEIAPDTARARGIANGDWIRIRTGTGNAVARARVSRDLAEGTVCAQHGWWVEGTAGSPYDREHPLAANLNQVIDTSRDDPVSGSIPLRASWCEIEKLASQGR
jgi:anaerobic selenocysteine-containing dehydrogenase